MLKLQILLYSFLIPGEFSIGIESLELSAYRVLLIVLFPVVIFKLITTQRVKWHLCDVFALSICIWPSFALLVNTNLLASIESGGILFLESFVPYFLARLTVTSYDKLKKISITVFKMVMILVALGLLDSITNQYFTHNIASTITGNTIATEASSRLGFLRAMGPMSHPIIYGSFCASVFAIAVAFFNRHNKYLPVVGVSIVGVITSLSSAPLLCMVVQVAFLLWSKIFSGNKMKWVLLLAATTFLYIVIDVLSNRDPFRVMFSYLLFNEHNGYVRYNMWSNSIFLANDSISSALFGYGFSSHMFEKLDSLFWATLMAKSVDTYWMVILLRYGWVMLLLNFIFIILIFKRNIELGHKTKSSRQRRLNEAWLISAVSFSLLACTVHFWGGTISFYMIILGCCLIGPKAKTSEAVNKASKRLKLKS